MGVCVCVFLHAILCYAVCTDLGSEVEIEAREEGLR